MADPVATMHPFFIWKVTGVDEVQMIITSAENVRPHIQSVTTYAADFDEVQRIEIDADDVDEWQFAYTDIDRTIYESQVSISCPKSFLVDEEHAESITRCRSKILHHC